MNNLSAFGRRLVLDIAAVVCRQLLLDLVQGLGDFAPRRHVLQRIVYHDNDGASAALVIKPTQLL
jgi:hypothetical protein